MCAAASFALRLPTHPCSSLACTFRIADPTITCGEGVWWSYVPFSVAAMLLYGVGIPLSFWAVLYFNRLNLFKELTIVKARNRPLFSFPNCVGCFLAGVCKGGVMFFFLGGGGSLLMNWIEVKTGPSA